MERCPHCGKTAITANEKFLSLYVSKKDKFRGGKCSHCQKEFISPIPVKLLKGILIAFWAVKIIVALLLFILLRVYIASALIAVSIFFDAFVVLGIIALFLPCVKYDKENELQTMPYANGIVTLAGEAPIKKMKIYGFRINEDVLTDEVKALFDDGIIPVRFVKKRGSRSEIKWYVDIFNKDEISKTVLKDGAGFILVDDNNNEIGTVTYKESSKK